MNQAVETTPFGESLAQLYQALADADPLTATPPAGATLAAEQVAGAFLSAPMMRRATYLLRSLDDAIAALEIAGRLADAYHSAPPGTQVASAPPDADADPLAATYAAFVAAQPAAFQTLYHYRNALATWVRQGEAPHHEHERKDDPNPTAALPARDGGNGSGNLG